MAKSKLHPLAKQLGFTSNEEFYKLYPTKQHYEMAMGGYYPEGGAATAAVPDYLQGSQQNNEYYANAGYKPTTIKTLPAAYRQSAPQYPTGVTPAGYNVYSNTDPNLLPPSQYNVTTPGQGGKSNQYVPYFNTPAAAPQAPPPVAPPAPVAPVPAPVAAVQKPQPLQPTVNSGVPQTHAKYHKPRLGSPGKNYFPSMFHKQGGSVFPQIQSADGFFSMGYENVPNPYTSGSFEFGGFPEIHAFPTQPRMPKNGREAYGKPTYGAQFLAQMGGADAAIQDQNVYNSTMDAMTPDYYDTDIFKNKIKAHKPQSGAGYQWPMSPNAPQPGGMPIGATPNYGGSYNLNYNFSTPYTQKMGGAPCYNCGGSKMAKGGTKKYASILKLDPADPETRDQLIPSFTEYLKQAALGATMQEMSNMHMMPDGSIMKGSMMNHGGTPEMFPYAMPYEYKDGGHWIQKAVNPKHKGYCTPMTKSTCTPRRKALARTFKKHHGFHQEGGTADSMQEAKWQAIMELTNQGITDPEEIATTLNNEGIYHTDPNEVAGYLQSGDQSQGQDEAEPQGQPEESPDYARYGAIMQKGGAWDFTPDYRQSEKIGQLKGALDKKGISYKDMSDEQIVKLGLDNHLISKSEDHNNSGYDPYGQNPYGNYMQGSGSYGWPGGAYKVKNKYNFYGNVNDRFSPQQRAAISNASNSGIVDPATAKALKDAGMWYKQDVKNDIWSRIGLANGPKRIHTEFGFGDQPNMGLPYDSGTGTTWMGDKLRQLTGPGKKKKARLAEEEQYNARKANQDSNAFMQPSQSTVDAAFQKDQAMRTSPNWEDNVQDKKLIPWLKDTAGRLGVTPESLVNPQVPQTGPVPSQTAPEVSNEELQNNYQKAVEERDRIFKENHINSRGRHRNILGIKYQNGGNQYAQLPPPSVDTMNSLKFNPNAYNDPNMDPENLPGYVPPPTLSNDEMVRATEGNPADQMGSGMNMSSDATRKKAGEADFWKDINTMNAVTNLAGIPHQERLRKKAKFDNRIENRVAPEQYRNRGDYTTNQGYFRPDQQNVGNMVTGAFGGAYQEGGQYDLTEEEIQMLRDGGYDIEYLD